MRPRYRIIRSSNNLTLALEDYGRIVLEVKCINMLHFFISEALIIKKIKGEKIEDSLLFPKEHRNEVHNLNTNSSSNFLFN